jgi:hypothetical protein
MSTETLTKYEYSFKKEMLPGSGSIAQRTRYRGRCCCGRQTHMCYSTPAIALSAIRLTHNPNTETERHHDDS